MDIHIVRGSSNAAYLDLVLHMDTASLGNNAAGVPFSTALILSGYSSGKSLLLAGDGTNGANGSIGMDELEQLAIGSRYEFSSRFGPDLGWDALSTVNKVAALRTWRTAQVAIETTKIQDALNYFGFAGT